MALVPHSSGPQSLTVATGTGPSADFGPFRIAARLAAGGMGEALLAVASGVGGFQKLVVIKRIHPDHTHDAVFRRAFLEEARLSARINHPNVVQTLEVGELEGQPYFTMEYLEGQSLAALLRRARHGDALLDLGIALRIVCDALAGLHYAHDLTDFDGSPLHIVHRDVSPHNIFVTYIGVSKILDFGIAKADAITSATEAGTFKGKRAYSAPEQIRGGTVDRRTDVFIVGIVLWEMLTGQALFRSQNPEETIYKALVAPIPRVKSVEPAIDEELDAIVAKALERDPSARYATANELRCAIEAYRSKQGLAASHDDVGTYISGLFSEKRLEVQLSIQSAVSAAVGRAAARHEPGANDIEVTKLCVIPAESASDSVQLPPSPATSASLPVPSVSAGDAPSTSVPAAGRRSPLIWFAAIAMVIGGLGVGLILVSFGVFRSPRTVAPAATPSEATAVPPTAPVTAPEAVTQPPSATPNAPSATPKVDAVPSQTARRPAAGPVPFTAATSRTPASATPTTSASPIETQPSTPSTSAVPPTPTGTTTGRRFRTDL